MTTVTTETLVQEHNRLLGEQAELSAAARRAGGQLDPEGRARYAAISQRLREIRAIPPAGYELPKMAADLVAHAEAHGWLSLVQWTPPDYMGDPFVGVQVGRRVTEADGYLGLGNCWKYQLTWSSRDCAPGKVRLWRKGLAETPANPGTHDAPSVKAIRAVIEQHPAREVVS